MTWPQVHPSKTQPHRKIVSSNVFEPRYLPNINSWQDATGTLSQHFNNPCLSIHIPATNSAGSLQYYKRSYLDALKAELQIIARMHPQPVCIRGVHWHGAPASNLAAAELTELVYTTMRQFRMRLGEECYALVDLWPQDANNDTLALLRGLGFKQLLLRGNSDFNAEQFDNFIDAAGYYNFQEVGVELNPAQCLPFISYLRQQQRNRILQSISLRLPKGEQPLTMQESSFKQLEHIADELSALGFKHLSPNLFQRNDLPIYLPLKSEHIGIGLGALSHRNNSYYINDNDIKQYLYNIENGRLAYRKNIQLRSQEQQMLHLMDDWFSQQALVVPSDNTQRDSLMQKLDNAVQQRLLVRDGNRYVATRKGKWMSQPFTQAPCSINQYRGL